MDRNPLSTRSHSAPALAHLVLRHFRPHRFRTAAALRCCVLVSCTAFLAARAFAQHSDWRLVWADEFDGSAGAAPDPSKWVFDTGAGGWGNEELENYTDSRENSYLDGGGNLVIESREPSPGEYTSARLKTQGKYEVEYGKIEARIKLPEGQGMWPAFWMLGTDIDRV